MALPTRPLWAVVCGTLNGVALLFTPVRYSHSLKDGGTLGSMVGGLVFIGLVAGLAAYLCSLDYRRTAAVSENRREQRLAIAADLHDFVAHHVTGILIPPGHDRKRNRVRGRRNEARPYLCRLVSCG
jgi:signal transduction histidine kinase